MLTHPEELAGQAVQREAGCALWEDSLVQGDVAFKYECVGHFFLGRRCSKVKRPRRIRRSVKELCSRVAKINFRWINDRAIAFLRLIVDHSRAVEC